MRAVFIVAATLAAAFAFGSCAEDGPTPNEVQQQLERGVTGQGQLTPGTDRGEDAHIKPRAGESDIPR
jgi:hypothetical protein